jgi:hypothetical protein
MSEQDTESKPGFFQRFILDPIKKLLIGIYNLIVVVLLILLVIVPIIVAGVYYSKSMDGVGNLGETTAREFVKGQLAEMKTAVEAGSYPEACYNKARLVGATAAWKATVYLVKVRYPDSPLVKNVSYDYQAFPKGSVVYDTGTWENVLDGWLIIYRYAIYDGVTNPPGDGCSFPYETAGS